MSCIKPKGAFYLFANVSKIGLKCEEVANLLLEKGKVVTVLGTAFGIYGEGHVRLSLTASMGDIKVAAERIKAVLEEL